MLVLSLPAIYALELTPACNNRCPGCSNYYSDRRRPAITTAAQWQRWLAEFGPEAVQMRLTGGEPTLHPGFFEILAAATAYDAWITVFTNGRWADPARFVDRLVGWPRLSGLLVSLHGARAASHEAFTHVPGSFDETLANVRRAVDKGVTVALSTVITRQSLPELEEVAALAAELGAQHVAFNRYLGAPLPDVEPDVDQLAGALQRVEAMIAQGLPVKYGIGTPQCFMGNHSEGCLAGAAYVAVDPWGRVHPCAHSPSLAGSLHERSLRELWHGPEMVRWRSLMPAECTACAAYTACHGGCRAVQELRADGRDPLRGHALSHWRAPATAARELPAEARPRAVARLRPEPWGYAVLGRGQVLAVRPDAAPLIRACDGTRTFAELKRQYGRAGLELLGDLWELGLLQPA